MSARSTGARSRSAISGRIGSSGRLSSVQRRNSQSGWWRFQLSIHAWWPAGRGSGPTQTWWMVRGIISGASPRLPGGGELPHLDEHGIGELGAQALLVEEPFAHRGIVGARHDPARRRREVLRIPGGLTLGQFFLGEVGIEARALLDDLRRPPLEAIEVLGVGRAHASAKAACSDRLSGETSGLKFRRVSVASEAGEE